MELRGGNPHFGRQDNNVASYEDFPAECELVEADERSIVMAVWWIRTFTSTSPDARNGKDLKQLRVLQGGRHHHYHRYAAEFYSANHHTRGIQTKISGR